MKQLDNSEGTEKNGTDTICKGMISQHFLELFFLRVGLTGLSTINNTSHDVYCPTLSSWSIHHILHLSHILLVVAAEQKVLLNLTTCQSVPRLVGCDQSGFGEQTLGCNTGCRDTQPSASQNGKLQTQLYISLWFSVAVT